MRSPSRLRRIHRLQATIAILGTVGAVFGVSRIIKAKTHPAPAPAATYAAPVYTAPIIPRTLPPVDPPAVPSWNTSALNSAAAEGDIQGMKAAYREGMPLAGAMVAAAEAGKADAVTWLIDHGATADDSGVVLAADKSPAVLKVLFAKGASEVTLSTAVEAGAMNATKRILAKGGDAAKVDETILQSAMIEEEDGSMPMFDLLLGARIPTSAIVATLESAVGDQGAKVVKKLAAKGIPWTWRDANGDEHAPLLDAVDRQDLPVVRAMLETGASANQANEFGKTALGIAIAIGAGTEDGMRIVRLLLQRGADPNRRMDTGERPLAKAAAAGDLRLVTMLLDHGAAVNAGFGSRDDETALEAAENGGHMDVARVLSARGARRFRGLD